MSNKDSGWIALPTKKKIPTYTPLILWVDGKPINVEYSHTGVWFHGQCVVEGGTHYRKLDAPEVE